MKNRLNCVITTALFTGCTHTKKCDSPPIHQQAVQTITQNVADSLNTHLDVLPHHIECLFDDIAEGSEKHEWIIAKELLDTQNYENIGVYPLYNRLTKQRVTLRYAYAKKKIGSDTFVMSKISGDMNEGAGECELIHPYPDTLPAGSIPSAEELRTIALLCKQGHVLKNNTVSHF